MIATTDVRLGEACGRFDMVIRPSRIANGANCVARMRLRVAIPAAAFAIACIAPSAASAVNGEVAHFTEEQAAKGEAIYARHCAACHGVDLDQGNAPALRGSAFARRWVRKDRSLRDLVLAVHGMPKQAPGSLSGDAYHDVTAYILSANGFRVTSPARMGEDLASLMPALHSVNDDSTTPRQSAVLPASPATVAVAQTSAPTDVELLHPAPSDWLMYNRTYGGDRFSPLSQINVSNVAKLQAVCIMSPGVLGSFQGSPIVYKGMGFITSTYGVYAFDATNCRRKWEYIYSPSGPEGIRTTRGLAIYDGKLFRGTSDGHLLAIDMMTGKLLWDTHVADGADGYSITAAPIAFRGRVIVGLAGGDMGNVGHVYAFDADTGKRVWTFDTIDSKAWAKGARHGGGGTWTTVAVDPRRGLVFVPVGNPAPDYFSASRPGGNLYTDSIVAIDADTGKIAWYVQQVAGDFHDWDTSAAPVLYESDGRRLMAVGTKAGYVYIYDRDTHRLVARTSVVTHLNDDLPLSGKPLRVCPGTTAGVEWNGPAFDPVTGSLFVNTVDWCDTFSSEPPQRWQRGDWYLDATVAYDPPEKMTGWTYALDAETGRVRWKDRAPKPMIGAVTPTAGGIVFTGGADGIFLALDARNGHALYRFNTGAAIGGGIATYAVNGRQYVAVASGGFGLLSFGVQGAPEVIVFALPSTSD